MKKLFTNLLLMLVLGVGSAWAEVSVGTSENTAEWWTYFSDYYTMTANQKAHINFKNCNSGSGANYNNWILAVTSDADRSATGYYEYLILRNDNAGWGNDYNPAGLSNDFDFTGTNFVTDMNNATVDMYITFDYGRINMTSTITTEGGTVYNYSCKSLYVPTLDKYRFFFTVDASHIEDLAVSYEDYTPATSTLQAVSTNTTETVGSTEKTSGWWTAFSPYYTVYDGQMAVVKFKDYAGDANYKNWTFVANTLNTERAGTGYSEYVVLRSDGYGWNADGNTNAYDATTNPSGAPDKVRTVLNNDFNWDNFLTDRDGADVELKVYTQNGYVVMQETTTAADGTTKYHQNYVSTLQDGMKGFSFFLTPQESYLTNVEYTLYGTTYTVTCNTAENGTVTSDVTTAGYAGAKVTLTTTPAIGYELDALTVTDADGNAVTVTDNTFTMPASNVTVTATFKEKDPNWSVDFSTLTGLSDKAAPTITTVTTIDNP